MKKLILILIKLIPLYTIYRGAMGGKNRLGPILNIGKTAFTQYEMKKMMNVLIKHYQESEGDLIRGDRVGNFLNKFHRDQYSAQVRSLVGNNPNDFSLDIWKSSYSAEFEFGTENYILNSPGPDLTKNTKDDIEITINIKGAAVYLDGAPNKKPQEKKQPKTITKIVEVEETVDVEQQDSGEYDSEGFNEEGYDRSGFDRDGYNEEGIHRDDVHLYEDD